MITAQDIIDAGYRQLALKHHPDRGGSAEEFRSLTAAMDALRKQVAEPRAPSPEPRSPTPVPSGTAVAIDLTGTQLVVGEGCRIPIVIPIVLPVPITSWFKDGAIYLSAAGMGEISISLSAFNQMKQENERLRRALGARAVGRAGVGKRAHQPVVVIERAQPGIGTLLELLRRFL